VEGDYLRLDCRIKRYSNLSPASFIIDAERKPPAAAVFDRRSHESLDHRKVQSPRPLKTHAYNFSYIEDERGRVLVRKRAANREEAEAFAATIIRAAAAISRESYLEDLDRVIWPPRPQEEPGMSGWESRLQAPQAPREYLQRDFFMPSRMFQHDMSLYEFSRNARGLVDAHPEEASLDKGERKYLVKETLRLMEKMDRDDLHSLYRFAQILLGE